MIKILILLLLFISKGTTMDEEVKEIITLPHSCLTTQADPIPDTAEGLEGARQLISSLAATLLPLMPAAGLASPQIGISKRVFIFSWDRSLEKLAGAINPSFEPLDEEMSLGWEGCFSVPLALARVSRNQNIRVSYTNTRGEKVRYILKGFAARVFQHEFDHLEGIENIHKPDAEIKTFSDKEELMAFISEVKKGDQSQYIEPEKSE